MAERVAVIGAGAWGMAIARLLDRNGHAVTLWAWSKDEYATLVTTRGNDRLLPRVRLTDSIRLTSDLAEAVSGARVLVLAVPAQYLRSILVTMPRLDNGVGIVNLAKGIEFATLTRMSELICEVTGVSPDCVATLSGPSHAEEVAVDMPTTVVAGGVRDQFVQEVQRRFSSGAFRVYSSNDIVGVELGGALKNIIALATGIADGLGYGDNTRGALITRGLAEVIRLGVALGARAETFAGLSGVGDLVATSTSRHSRNRMVGEQLGRGRRLTEILSGMPMVAEGVETTRAALLLAQRNNVPMPITREVHHVLFDDKPSAQAVADLMGRSLKAEIWT